MRPIHGRPVTPPRFAFSCYDGLVLPAPAVDYNYEVTVYRLERGTHVLRWASATPAEESERLVSNELTIRVE